MKRVIIAVVVLALLGVVVYDASKYFSAVRELRGITYTLAASASTSAPTMSREQAGTALVRQAAADGVRVYQYDQDERRVRVWTERDVNGTVILGTVWNIVTGVPFADALNRPFTINDYQEAGIR